MNRIVHILAAAASALALATTATTATTAQAQVRAEPEVQPTQVPAKRAERPMPTQATRITLPAAVPPKLATEQKPGTPTQVGFSREVAELAQPGDVDQALRWERAEDGSAQAALSITSPGAAAVRANLRFESLPAGTLLRFIGTESQPYEVAAGSIPLGEAFWSPVVEGQTLLMAFDVPAGSDPSGLTLSIPEVSHLFKSVTTDWLVPKAAGACNLDATC